MNHDRLTSALTWAFAFRSWQGAIKRVLAISILLILISQGVNLAVPTATAVPFHISMMRTLLTALPFMALVFYVVTQLELMRQRLVKGASTDMLTGLRNRANFFDQGTLVHRASQGSVLLMIDADHFKRVNDLYGHAAGDETLRAISRRLRSLVREGDVVGRLGGEEFAVVLPDTTLAEGLQIGERLAKGLDVPLEPDGHLLAITLSVGAVEMPPEMPLEAGLVHADEALYSAKARGRARVELWESEEAA